MKLSGFYAEIGARALCPRRQRAVDAAPVSSTVARNRGARAMVPGGSALFANHYAIDTLAFLIARTAVGRARAHVVLPRTGRVDRHLGIAAGPPPAGAWVVAR